jgi:FMN phosphatase YigB (HAD superfamily)
MTLAKAAAKSGAEPVRESKPNWDQQGAPRSEAGVNHAWYEAKIAHLLIDLDGTLVDFREMATRAEFVSRSLRGLRRELPELGWLSTLRALRAIKAELRIPAGKSRFPEATNSERAALVFSRSLGIAPARAREVLDRTMESVFSKLGRHFFPIPGAREFVDWAHSRLPVTLATNPVWPLELVHSRVRWGGIDPARFCSVTHSGVMHACKPTRQYYLETLRLASGEAEPKAAAFLHVGNELVNDLPATRIGVPVFIVSKESRFKLIQRPKGGLAPAWTGSFSDLRSFLADRLP